MKAEHSVRALCATFAVKRSGYLAWSKAPTCQREQSDAQLTEQIEAVHQKHKGRYGAPRIQDELADQGQRHGVKRIARLMKAEIRWGISRGKPTRARRFHSSGISTGITLLPCRR